MYTRCTHCDTWFAIGATELRQGHGEVRCGSCLHSFDALLNLCETLPDPDQRPATDEGRQAPDRSDGREADHLAGPAADQSGDHAADQIPDQVAGVSDGLEHPVDQELAGGQVPWPGDPDFARPANEEAPPGDVGRRAVSPEEVFNQLMREPRAEEIGAPRVGDLDALARPEDTDSQRADESSLPARLSPDRPLYDPVSIAALEPAPDRGRDLDRDPDRDPEREAGLESGPDSTRRAAGSAWSTPPAASDRGEPERETAAVPAFLREDFERLSRARQRRRQRWLQGAAALLLVFSLLAQYAWFMPEDLSRRYPLARPALERLCAISACELPSPRDVSRIRLVSRDVRIHPRYEGALQITASLENSAPFAQPFPQVEFTVYNVNGQTIASRRFAPREYLGPGVDSGGGMLPNRPVQIVLNLLAPEEAAISFEFRFI